MTYQSLFVVVTVSLVGCLEAEPDLQTDQQEQALVEELVKKLPNNFPFPNEAG